MRVPPNFASPQQNLEKKQNAASSSYHESEKENHPPTIHDDSFLSMNPSQDNSRSISSPISSSLTQSDRRNSSTTTCSSNNRNDENHQNSNEWNTCFSSFDENSCCSNDADDDGTTTCWNDASKGFRKNNDGSKNNHTSPSSSSDASSLVLNHHHQRVVVVVDETMSQGTEELKKRPRGISSNFGEEDSEAMSMNGVGHDDTTIDQDDSICLRKRINPLKSKRVKKNDHPLTSDSAAFQDSWTLYSLSDTPQEMIEIIISFLDDSSRALAALTCSKFHQACENIVAREFTYYFHQENNSLILPLAQGPVSTNDIENVQNKFNMTLPFLLKIFLTLTDGREPWHNTFIHFSNMIRPIREWKLLKRDVLLLGTTLDSNIQLLVNSNHVFFLRNVTQNSLERLHFKDWIQRKNFSFEYVHYNIEKVNERRVLPYSLTHFNSIPPCCMAKKNIVRNMLSQKGLLLNFVSREFMQDEELVLCAVKQDPMAFKMCSHQMKSNVRVVLETVKKRSDLLQLAGECCRNNPEVVLTATAHCQDSLENTIRFAGKELKANKEFMLKAVQACDMAFKYASEELRNDPELALLAVKKRGWILQYASKSIRQNRNFVLQAIQWDAKALKYVSEVLRQNRSFIMEAIQRNPKALENAPDTFRNDREIVRETVQQDGLTLAFASNVLRNDLSIVVLAMTQNPKAIQFASNDIQFQLGQHGI